MKDLSIIYQAYVLVEAICRKISIAFLGIGFFGNMLIIIYFVKVNKNKLLKMSAYHFLIVQLAIVDAFICVVFPISISLTDHFTYGRLSTLHFCLKIVFSSSMVVSAWILMFISFLRYRSIAHPLTPLWSKRKFFICIALVFSCWLVIGVFEIFEIHINKNGGFVNLTYGLIFKGLEFIIPSTLTVVFYFKSRRVLKSQNVIDSTVNQQQIRRRNKTALKTLKHLMTVYFVTVFLTKFLEIFSMIVMASFIVRPNTEVSITLAIILTILFYTFSLQNNILNVVVYAIVMKDFRQFLKEFLQQCFICKRKSS